MSAHVRDDLPLYALGLLEGAERTAVERHLDACADCRGELALAEATVAALSSGLEREPSPGLRSAIVARHARRSSLPAWPRLAIGVGVAVAALVLAALVTVEQIVPLEAKGTSGSGAAVVARGGSTYLLLAMPVPPAGQTYEAWVLRDGAAIPAGLAPAGQGFAVVPLEVALRPGDVAAVTVEISSGARSPTSDPVLIGGRGPG